MLGFRSSIVSHKAVISFFDFFISIYVGSGSEYGTGNGNVWEARTLEKSHSNSLYNFYSETL
jgi:hypothetical protein